MSAKFALTRVIIIAAALALAALPILAQNQATAPASRPAFTDVTKTSGIPEMLQRGAKDTDPSIDPEFRMWISSFDLIDMDDDGHLDLFVGGHGCYSEFGRNDGKGHFAYVDPKPELKRGIKVKIDLPVPGGELRTAADLFETGKLDMFVSYHDDGGVFYRNNCAPGQFDFKRGGKWDFFFRSDVIFDVNRDGFADFLCNTGDNGRNNGIRILYGDKEHKFEKSQVIPGRNWLGIPTDIDGDGQDELVQGKGGGYGGGELGGAVMRFNKDGTGWDDLSETCGMSKLTGYTVKGVMDLNHDGFPDLVCLSEKNARVTGWLNDGKGHFTLKEGMFAGLEKLAKPKAYAWGQAVMVDLDNDGIGDVIINGRSFLYVFRGKADGTYEPVNKEWNVPTGAYSAVSEGRCFGDIDHDGMIDLVVCTFDSCEFTKGRDAIALLHNDLPKKNHINVRPIGQSGNRMAAGAKIRLYEPGGMGDARKLLAYEEVTIWGDQSSHSYYFYPQTERHFGLGDRPTCDLSVEFSTGKKVLSPGVKANQTVLVQEDTGKTEPMPAK